MDKNDFELINVLSGKYADYLRKYYYVGGMQVVPVEVKAEENLQAKSLKSFCKKYIGSIGVFLLKKKSFIKK